MERLEPTPSDEYAKDVDEEQLEAQLDDEEGINDDHNVEEGELWEEGGEEEGGEETLEPPIPLTITLPKAIPGVPGVPEETGEEKEEAPVEPRKTPKLPTVKTTVATIPTAPRAPRAPRAPPTALPTVPPTTVNKPAPPLPPGYAMIPAKPKAKGKAVAKPVYVEPEVDLEELVFPDPHEDLDSYRFREKYTYALTALPSPWSDLKASSKVVLGYMAVKKARYGIKYDPSVEALLTKLNELLIPLFANA